MGIEEDWSGTALRNIAERDGRKVDRLINGYDGDKVSPRFHLLFFPMLTHMISVSLTSAS